MLLLSPAMLSSCKQVYALGVFVISVLSVLFYGIPPSSECLFFLIQISDLGSFEQLAHPGSTTFQSSYSCCNCEAHLRGQADSHLKAKPCQEYLSMVLGSRFTSSPIRLACQVGAKTRQLFAKTSARNFDVETAFKSLNVSRFSPVLALDTTEATYLRNTPDDYTDPSALDRNCEVMLTLSQRQSFAFESDHLPGSSSDAVCAALSAELSATVAPSDMALLPKTEPVMENLMLPDSLEIEAMGLEITHSWTLKRFFRFSPCPIIGVVSLLVAALLALIFLLNWSESRFTFSFRFQSVFETQVVLCRCSSSSLPPSISCPRCLDTICREQLPDYLVRNDLMLVRRTKWDDLRLHLKKLNALANPPRVGILLLSLGLVDQSSDNTLPSVSTTIGDIVASNFPALESDIKVNIDTTMKENSKDSRTHSATLTMGPGDTLVKAPFSLRRPQPAIPRTEEPYEWNERGGDASRQLNPSKFDGAFWRE
ncbi:hypothetical protein C8J56DRAFT_1029656 [Mycena floridula]|nr:hypothetical protein C8J56DRAFT_1029656 [Mycena floridula]